MKDDLKKGRRPKKYGRRLKKKEDDLKNKTKMKDNLKHN